MRETRERKPVDYSSTGFNAGTGTPSWLKVSSKPAASNENKAPLPFSIMEDVVAKKVDSRKSTGSKPEASKPSNDQEKKRKSAPSSSGPLEDLSNVIQEAHKQKKAKVAAAAPPPIEVIASKPIPKPVAVKPAPAVVQEVIVLPPVKPLEAAKAKSGRPSSSLAAAAAAATAKQSAKEENVPPPAATKEATKSKTEPGPSEKKKVEDAADLLPDSIISQLLDPSAAVNNPKSFVALQEQYVQLQNLYQQLKAQKIQDLEGLLEEQDEYVENLNSSVTKLADHWKKEAEKQAEIGRLAGSSEFVAKAENLALENSGLKQSNAKLQEDIVRLRKEVLEREARMVAAQAQVAELRTKLEAHIAAAQAAATQFEAEKMRLVSLRGGPTAVALALAQMTPAPLAGHRNTWMQCPTPPVPSPGIGMQFPSPFPQANLIESRGVDAQVQPIEGIVSLQDERRMDDGTSSEPLAPPTGLSAGMIQLMASAQMTAKKLSQGVKSRSNSDLRSEPHVISPPGAVEGETSNQGSSNRIPAVDAPQPEAPALSPQSSPGLSLASMTPGKTALLGGVVDFFGFKVLPLRVPGAFEYIHPKTGLRFQMGPIEVEDSELAAEERADQLPDLTLDAEGQEEQSSVNVLLYRPLSLGKAKLPAHLCDELMVPLFSKDAFVNQLWKSVNG